MSKLTGVECVFVYCGVAQQYWRTYKTGMAVGRCTLYAGKRVVRLLRRGGSELRCHLGVRFFFLCAIATQ